MAFVEHFYRDLADGQDEGAALHLAKLDLIKEFGREASAKHRATAYGWCVARVEVKGGLFTSEVAKLVVEAGIRGKPLDIPQLGIIL